MKKLYFSVLALAVTLFMCVGSAKAQYAVTVNSAPHNNYLSGGQEFSPSEIANALGTDTATLHKLISDGGNVYLKAGESKTNEYTGNSNEFWMNAEAVPVAYGADGCCWYGGISYEPAGVDEETQEAYEASISVYVGQFPDYFKKIYTPSALSCTMYIVNGEKEVSFDITQNVEAAKQSTLTAPVTELSKLNIVKDYTLTLPFIVGKSYEGKTYAATFEGLYEALGVEAADLDENINDHVLTQTVHTEAGEDNSTYSFEDILATPESAASGSWFGRYINFDEASGKDVPLEMNGPKNWASGCTFYTQSITLADGKFSIVSGQYPETFVVGDTDYTYLYIVVGDKAARIKVQVEVKEPEKVDQDQMVKVGEQTVQVTAEIDNNYLTKAFSVDMAAVAEALGLETADIDDFSAYDQEGNLSNDHNEGSGGYYFNDEGRLQNWGDQASFFVGVASIPEGNFTIGQMQNHFAGLTEPQTVSAQLVFINVEKYYVVNIEYTVTPAKAEEDKPEYTRVAVDPLYMEMIPSPDTYEYATKTPIDLDYIESKIGTKDFVLYTDKAKTVDEETTLVWDKNYSCDPKPGFWFGDKTYTNAEGLNVVDNAGWGSNAFGVTYANGELTWFQFPGQRSAGESYIGNLYLVNEETGNYLQYILNVSYVETESEASKIVKTVEDTLTIKPESMTEEGYYIIALDAQLLTDSLGVDASEFADALSLYAFKTPNTRASYGLDEEFVLNADGYVEENPEVEKIMTAALSCEEGVDLYVDLGNFTFEKANEEKAVIRFSIEANGKRIDYVYVLLSEDSPLVGIEDIAAGNEAAASIYGLSGTKVSKLAHGVNIVKYSNGTSKKILVK